MVCHCDKTFSQEIDFLSGVFSQNGYPEDLFTTYLRRFVDNKCYKSTQNSKIKDDRVETIFSYPILDSLPSYLVGNSRNYAKKYYCIDIRVVFTSFEMKNYSSLKCRASLPLLDNVVYKFKCLCYANNTYIGETIRHLTTRVKALHVLLYLIISHHAKHTSQTFHVIIFQVLVLAKII